MKNDERLSREFQKEHGKAMGKYDRAYPKYEEEIPGQDASFCTNIQKGYAAWDNWFSHHSLYLRCFCAFRRKSGENNKKASRQVRIMMQCAARFRRIWRMDNTVNCLSMENIISPF